MKRSFYIYRTCAVILCLALLVSALFFGAQANTLRSYKVTLDSPQSKAATNMPVIVQNYELGAQDELTLAGWIKTDLVMQSYEYSIDGKAWIQVQDAIQARPDTEKDHCPNTWQTAGFHFSIDVSDLERGKHDIFVRGYTDSGDMINVLAMLNMSIGLSDLETANYREINLAAFGAQNNVLTLDGGRVLSIGSHHLRDFKRIEIVLDSNSALTLASPDLDMPNGFSLTQSDLQQNQDGTYTASISLENIQYVGDIFLSAAQDVKISSIRLYYYTPDYYTDSLKIHMTVTPFDFLNGENYVKAALMADQTVGTYVRLIPSDNTGDPYIYFNAGTYLKQTMGIQISADNYPYAVITAQSPKTNSPGKFGLFLCAGKIKGPSPDSYIAFNPINDGKWHTYVIPLYQAENWTGTIYGMRFDFIEASATPSDYTNIASVGFYPDLESANAAANAPFEIYHEDGKLPQNKFEEEGRAPSGRADAITWFDTNLTECFGGANKVSHSFDDYGHLIMTATETTNDPYLSFDMQTYSALTGLPLLKAQEYQTIVLRILADENIEGKHFSLYYYSGGLGYAEGTRSIGATFEGEDWEYLVYDMKNKPYWTDDILGMRLDCAGQIKAGQSVYLSDILFFADMDAWQQYAKENGLIAETATEMDTVVTIAPETERPTIEIPTQGPGLEYIPPQTESTETEIPEDERTEPTESEIEISTQEPDSAPMPTETDPAISEQQSSDSEKKSGCNSTVFWGNSLLFALIVLCVVLLSACVPSLPDPDHETEQQTEELTEEQTSDQLSTQKETTTQVVTTEESSQTDQQTTEEITTYGPLHFPEDTTQ